MASVYKRRPNSSKSGAVYYVGYTDHEGRRRTVKGFTDKAESKRLGAKLEHEAMLKRRGLIDPDTERAAERRKAPLELYLKAFEKHLSKTSPKHRKLVMSRVRRVVKGCGFDTITDVSIEAVVEFLDKFAKEEGIGNRTYNHYVQAIDEFCKWLVKSKRASNNPLVGMERLNTEVDVRHRRRALTPEEFGKLVESARASGISIQMFDGEQRARIYILSYMTGLRRGEIASLTPQSFALESAPPTLTVEAAYSKHRRRDVLPLHPELVAMLREWLPGLAVDQVLFPKLAKRRTWLMVKKDLERAGIEYETAEGIADFHAAGRHTHITQLLRHGATLPEAKELARHTDIAMTMRYTHVGIADQAKALRQLPWNGNAKGEGTEASRNAANPNGSSAQRIGSGSGDPARHNGSHGDSRKSFPRNDASPVSDRACLQKSSPDNECQKWRRRESNLRTISTQLIPAYAIAKTANSAALQMRCILSASRVTTWRRLTLICRA